MALNTNIPLQTTNPQTNNVADWARLGLLGTQQQQMEQSIAASQASQALTEAQTPGAVASSQKQQLETKIATDSANAVKDAVDLDPNTGLPQVDAATGAAKINIPKAQLGLFRAGNGAAAMKLEADRLANQSAGLDNAAKAIALSSSIVNTSAVSAQAAYDHAISLGYSVADAENEAQKQWEYLSNQGRMAAAKQGYQFDPKQFTYTKGLEKPLYEAQITPSGQKQLQIAQGNLDVSNRSVAVAENSLNSSLMTNFTDQNSQDASSPQSQRARDIVQNSTGTILPGNMSATDIYNNPLYKNLLTSQGNASVTANAAKQEAARWGSIDTSIDAAKDQLSKLGYTPAEFAMNWVNRKVISTPELAALYAQLSLLPPEQIQTAQDFNSLKAVAKAMKAQAAAQASAVTGGGRGAIVPGSGTSPNVAPGQNVSQPAPVGNPTAPLAPAPVAPIRGAFSADKIAAYAKSKGITFEAAKQLIESKGGVVQ